MGFYTYHNIDDPLTIRYVALGKQKQWGYATKGSASTTAKQNITLPISFNTANYVVLNTPQHTGVDIDGYYFYLDSKDKSFIVFHYTQDRFYICFGY